jgi:N12 class adenine-specific DNA methylase
LEDSSHQRIYFVKYHRTSKWKADNFFTLNYFSTNENAIYQSKRRFEILFLKKLLNPENIEIFYAFHDKNQDNRDIFTISEQQFDRVSEHLT